MNDTNLAAAILRLTASSDPEGSEAPEYLTNEDAINLADWLQSESPMNIWRSIALESVNGRGGPGGGSG